ncbi:MAG: hypothetical protein WD768_15180 [Phycisphaeraceae bacterium]
MDTRNDEQEVYGFVLTEKFVYTRKDSRYFARAIVEDVRRVEIRHGRTSANPALQFGFALVLIGLCAILFLSALYSLTTGQDFSDIALGGSPAGIGLGCWLIYDGFGQGWIVTFFAADKSWRFVADERCTTRQLREIADAFAKRYGWEVTTPFV